MSQKYLKLLYLIDLLFFLFIVFGNLFLFFHKQKSSSIKSISPKMMNSFSPSSPSRFTLPNTTFGDLIKKNRNPQSTPAPLVLESPTSPPIKIKTLVIALLGDSMIQTMYQASYLQTLLETTLPGYSVKILNFGIGSTNIEQGLARLPQVFGSNPDIIVVESFAYNIGSMEVSHHRQILKEIVSSIFIEKKKVVILATIAPNSKVFAKGTEEINFTDETRAQATDKIKEVLEETTKFAQEENLPLADAYHSSLDQNGEGKVVYIDEADHLHPSSLGHRLVGQKIANTISKIILN